MTSVAYARQFFNLRARAQIALASERYWRWLALRAAKEARQCREDASSLLDAAVRKGAEAIVACSQEERRRNADAATHRLADVLAWLDSAELEATEAATVARLAEERAT